MKICIVTITNSCNFGGRLQNYALQEELKKLFPDSIVETAINVGSDIKPLRDPVRFRFAEKILRLPLLRVLNDKIIKNPLLGKKIRFIEFNRREIRQSRWILNKNYLPKSFTKAYDYYICGSDQIWNPIIHFNSFVEYLPSVVPGKKISYSASFGVDSLEGDRFEFAQQNIQTFLPENISVRENAGITILNKMGVDGCSLTLDPTLLLTGEQWSAFEKKPNFSVPERYVISYMLGTSEVLDAKKRADELGVEFINIYDGSVYEYYSIGPKEFVYLIHHADTVFTDSFHAMVFSIIFHKKLRIYYREGMTARIDTLFMTIHRSDVLDSRRLDDYTGIDRYVDQQRNYSVEFLKSRLNNGKENGASDDSV